MISNIYFFAMIKCSFILLLWTMLLILSSRSTEAYPWKRLKINFTTKANILKWDILAFSNQKLSKRSVASLKSSKTDLSGILRSPTVFEKISLKTRHRSASFEMVLFPSVIFISLLFENLFEKSGTTLSYSVISNFLNV